MKLVLFSSPLCKPCDSLKLHLEKVYPTVKYTTVNAQDDFETSMKYKIRSTPTMLLLSDDNDEEVISSAVGFTKLEDKEKVDKLIFQFNKY